MEVFYSYYDAVKVQTTAFKKMDFWYDWSEDLGWLPPSSWSETRGTEWDKTGSNPVVIGIPFNMNGKTYGKGGRGREVNLHLADLDTNCIDCIDNVILEEVWPWELFWFRQIFFWRRVQDLFPDYVVFGRDCGVVVNRWLYTQVGVRHWKNIHYQDQLIGGYKDPLFMFHTETVPWEFPFSPPELGRDVEFDW